MRSRSSGERPTNDLIGSLTQEWREICQRPRSTAVVAEWAKRHSALRAYRGLAEISDTCESASEDVVDRIFTALLRTVAASDDETSKLAARTLLQLMMPKIVQISRCLTHLPTYEERDAIAVAGMYEAISTWRASPQTCAMPAQLGRTAMRCIQRSISKADMRACAVERPTDFDEEQWLDVPTTAEPTPDDELYDILIWAVNSNVISRHEAQELVYGIGYGCGKARADQLGIRLDTLSSFRRRALKKIQRAVRRFRPQPRS